MNKTTLIKDTPYKSRVGWPSGATHSAYFSHRAPTMTCHVPCASRPHPHPTIPPPLQRQVDPLPTLQSDPVVIHPSHRVVYSWVELQPHPTEGTFPPTPMRHAGAWAMAYMYVDICMFVYVCIVWYSIVCILRSDFPRQPVYQIFSKIFYKTMSTSV